MRTWLHSVLVLALLAGSAAAQNPPPPPILAPDVFPWQGGNPEEPFTRTAMARLMGEQVNHAIVLRRDVPVLLYEPSVFESFMELHSIIPTNDFDTLRKEQHKQTCDHDLLILARPTGLDQFTFENGLPVVTPIDHGTNFLDASLVRVHDVNNDHLDDIVVLSADRKTIRVKKQLIDGTFVDESPSITLTRTVIALDIMEYDGDPSTAEFVVDTTSNLKVLSRTGSALFTANSQRSDFDCFTVLKGASVDKILWCTASNLTDQNRDLFLIDGAVKTLQTTTSIGISHLAAGDFDGSSPIDVVVSRADEKKIHILYAQTGSTPMFSFDPANSWSATLDAAGSSIPSQARPLVADLSNDGNFDILIPLNGTEQVFYFDGVLNLPSFEGAGGTQVDFVIGQTCKDDQSTEFAVNADVFPKATFAGLDSHYSPSDDWRIESKVFVMAHAGSTIPAQPSSYCLKLPNEYPHVSASTVEVGFDCDDFGRSFFLYLRFVRVSGTTIVQAGPPLLGGVTNDPAVVANMINHDINGDPGLIYPGWNGGLAELVNDCILQNTGYRLDGFARVHRFPPTSGSGSLNPPCWSKTHQ
jgi:hypothetical protein